ncbi:MAG: TIM barrel protein [Planctomycetota bacterium]
MNQAKATDQSSGGLTRRGVLQAGVVGAAAAALPMISGCQTTRSSSGGVQHGRVKQVPANWCFTGKAGPKPWTLEELLDNTEKLGMPGVELVKPDQWHLLKDRGLVCAATPGHGFTKGMNNLGFHEENIAILKERIKASADAGFPNVMTFTGMADTSNHTKGGKVTAEQGMANCIAGYKKAAPYAADLGVSMVLEPLNSRDPKEMRGHPGYQGDHVDYCAKIVREVDSPGLRLLFDVYHVQIMDGDLVRRIHENKDIIGHVQIAGNPGRGPIGPDQEINYRAVMQAFVDIGYEGYVGHEWIPAENPFEELKQAVEICDV